MNTLQQSIWLCLPLTLGGITHVAMIKADALPSLARLRLDCGMKLRGRDLFGANKTVRGAVVMICATIVWTIVLDHVQTTLNLDADLRYIPMEQLGSASLGFLFGSAYIVGELPNSLIKRQLNIPPGSVANGQLQKLFWFVDQVDSVVAVLIALSFVRRPNPEVYLLVIAFTLILHPTVATLMVALKLKQRVG
ncbi:MAG: CDP-archaeol synthase [Xanthomonadales bacterium]|nr:CDP-archaeol synthase [Xanthomonadales bacterium]